MVSFNFIYPFFLWFLLVIPLFFLIYFSSFMYHKKRSVVFSNFKAIERFYGVEFFSKNFVSLYINIFIIVLLVFSLSGTSINFESDSGSYSFVVLIDNSQSMSANDILPDRFSASKSSAKSFIEGLPLGVNVGVIGFSGESVVYQELTTNKFLLQRAIDSVEYGRVGGTNIHNALINADRLFGNVDDGKNKAVLLYSDGQANVGDINLILDFAKRNDIVIHTIGVGTEYGGVTNIDFISKADIDFLKALSFNTGGLFFRVEEANEFDDILTGLIDKGFYESNIDLSMYLLISAIILFTLYWFFYNFRIKAFP
ncbi:MAG: VWA domain-containing protein [Bacilli bacterium]